MADVTRFTVSIGGEQYTVVSDESAETVHETARMVDEIVSQVLQSRSDMSREKAAVLAALKLANNVASLEQHTASYRDHAQKIADTLSEYV